MKKILYPYLIIEFILFSIFTVIDMKEESTILPKIFLGISIGLSVIFLSLTTIDNLKSRIFGIISFGLIFAFIPSNIYLFYSLGMFASLIELNIRRKQNILLEVLIFVPILIILIILSIIFKDSLYGSLIHNSIIIVPSLILIIVLSIIGFKNEELKRRPNYFFRGVAAAFLLSTVLFEYGLIYFPETASVISLLKFSLSSLPFISYIMMAVSFMTFQPHEA